MARFSSLAAGVVLRLARPVSAGERVLVFVPELNRVVEAEIVRVGVVSTTLATADGLFVLRNAQLLSKPALPTK